MRSIAGLIFTYQIPGFGKPYKMSVRHVRTSEMGGF
jgi:hypothetical protein